MRGLVPAAAVALAFLVGPALGGCGGTSDQTPVACLEGEQAYLVALRAAPGEVRLGGETPISDCLTRNQSGGDLATVGGAMVTAATRLDAEARAEPGGAANVALGYLLGAATRGAEDTEGIHAELLRRLTAAAHYSSSDGPLPGAFRRAYRGGFEAGEAGG
jgi:hypothetical protein